MEGDLDSTQALTEGGTQAASPHAIAQHVAAGSAQSSAAPIGQSSAALVEAAPRIHMFHLFGAVAPLLAIGVFAALGGDPLALHLTYAGCVVLSACNLVLVWMTARPDAYRAGVAGAVWLVSVASTQPIVYYFGPFTGAIVINVLGIWFVSFGTRRRTALATVAITVGCHIAMALPVALHAVHDRGMLPGDGVATYRLVVAEALLVALMLASYGLGRWARRTNAAAMTELKSAMRVLGDKEQVLAEVRDEAARARRVDEGRWTGQTLGTFKLGLVLGRGGMGEVYEATDADGKPAAVKLLNARATSSASLVERFHREMVVAARLDSPHIVKVLEVSADTAPVPYIAMERLHGTDLATKLRHTPRLPSDEVVALVDQVARGLEVARIAGIVHRDLKPHNLFHHDGATWKILDFGVSKLAGGDGTLTGEGIVGTPQYMAPEQASGGEVTHRADVYALGAIAYRCLTGRSPFKGDDLSELVFQVVTMPPLRPSTFGRVHAAVEDVLAVAMAKDPARRFASAIELANALVAARRGRVLAVAPPANAWR